MNIFITGANGFVGSNLSKYLDSNKYHVYKLIRNSTEKENLTWEDIDNKSIDLNHFDVYIHLAGKVHDLKNIKEDNEYLEVNYFMTKKIFDLFIQSTGKIFIFMSSVKAAMDHFQGKLSENIIPDPKTAYGKSKLAAEKYILSQTLPYNKKVYILRACMIHGPGNKGNLNILYQFVNKGIPYPLLSFKNERSFLSIENLCFIITKIISKDYMPSGIYNVADDEPISTSDLVRIIGKVINKKPIMLSIPKAIILFIAFLGNIIHLSFNKEQLVKLTEDYVVDNNKIKKALGISNLPISTKEGLIKTIKSFNK